MTGKYELTFFDEEGQIHSICLNDIGKRTVTFGRSAAGADIVMCRDCVSRIHGKLFLTNDGVRYQDVHSTNGTVIVEGKMKQMLYQTDRQILLHDNAILKIRNRNEEFVVFVRQMRSSNGWKKIAVGNKRLTIGRAGSNDIILPYPSVSKAHAYIEHKGNNYYLTDNKSKNGTSINGNLIRQRAVLHDGDVIQILDIQLIFVKGILYYCTKVQGVHLIAKDICKVINKDKVLLNHVNLDIQSNEFVAIIGGSGAGKTTLMNAISGFDKECTGQIFFNGHSIKKEFELLKDMIGYVPQQEIIYENLTLYHMLRYTAKMKMPKDTDAQEVDKRINEVLEMVELIEHKDTFIRKLSGGQKKRASIAVELLADPKLFFLDEPTSGLDPGTEENLMMLLNRLSKTRDKTTILVTHTTQNLHLCDKVIFMGPGGYLCFYGTVSQAKMFFQTDSLVGIYNIIAQDPKFWAQQYQNCCESYDAQEMDYEKDSKLEKRKVSVFRQLGVLTSRYAELIWNDKLRLLILLMQPIIIALLLKLVSNENIYKIYETTQSMMFSLSCSAIWIGLFNSIQEICKERSIVKREYMASMKLPLYILSKFVVQFILAAIQALLLFGVFAVVINDYPEGILFGNFFFEMYITVLLTVLSSMAIGMTISALVKSGDKAMTLAPFVLIVQLLFSGILFKLEGAGKSISYVTISKWSVAALGSIVNLNDLELKMQSVVPTLEHEFEEIYKHTQVHLFQNWGVLALMTVIFLILSGVLLINIKNDSR